MPKKIDLESDAQLMPSDQVTTLIAELAQRQLDLEAQVAEKEQELKDLNDQLREVAEKLLPEALTNAGVDELRLSNGVKVSIKEDLAVSVGKDRMPGVCQWLRDNGHDDIIKSNITVALPKGTSPDLIGDLQERIDDLGMSYTQEENVHTQTLKALLKEQMERGVPIQLSQFGAYPWRKTKIKLP